MIKFCTLTDLKITAKFKKILFYNVHANIQSFAIEETIEICVKKCLFIT